MHGHIYVSTIEKVHFYCILMFQSNLLHPLVQKEPWDEVTESDRMQYFFQWAVCLASLSLQLTKSTVSSSPCNEQLLCSIGCKLIIYTILSHRCIKKFFTNTFWGESWRRKKCCFCQRLWNGMGQISTFYIKSTSYYGSP